MRNQQAQPVIVRSHERRRLAVRARMAAVRCAATVGALAALAPHARAAALAFDSAADPQYSLAPPNSWVAGSNGGYGWGSGWSGGGLVGSSATNGGGDA